MDATLDYINDNLSYSCKICGRKSKYISDTLGVCLNCIRILPDKTKKYILDAHKKSRKEFSLPDKPPGDKGGIKCGLCINNCKIKKGKKGYCGLRKNTTGKLIYLKNNKKDRAVVDWYYDPIPTNCVADWICAGCSNSGYPHYSYSPGTEYGYKNLAVFFGACSLDCLFCQNWHFREMAESLSPIKTTEELVNSVDYKTSCICFFGGDPSVQIEFALAAAKKAIENKKNKFLRICWETNGTMSRKYLKKAVEISLISGGCIKFDLKAYDGNLFFALTGSSNHNTLKNFEIASDYIKKRKDPPLVVASTLLVPGYIDEKEIKKIATFICNCNPDIPYKLLGFHPQFYMSDFPPTSKKLALSCLEMAKNCGLKNVDIGNKHLLI